MLSILWDSKWMQEMLSLQSRFPNFQNEVLALADASAVDSSAALSLLRFPLAGRETWGVSALC